MIGSLARHMVGSGTQLGLANHVMGIGLGTAFRQIGNKNESLGTSVVKGAAGYAAETLVRGAFWLPTIVDLSAAATNAVIDHKWYGQSKIQKYYRGNFGGDFRDSQQAATMRQRGIQAMQQSRMNARSMLGSEARTFHR